MKALVNKRLSPLKGIFPQLDVISVFVFSVLWDEGLSK